MRVLFDHNPGGGDNRHRFNPAGAVRIIARAGAALRPWKLIHRFNVRLDDEADRLFLWSPVLMAAGIAGYFALPEEPVAATTALALVLSILSFWRGLTRHRPWRAVALVLFGFVAACLKTQFVSHPTVPVGIGYVQVEGWTERVERRDDRSRRITVRTTKVERLPESANPMRLRIIDRAAAQSIAPGQFITLRARLFPLSGPVTPRAHDFARSNWFRGIAGSGYAVSGPEVVDKGLEQPISIWLSAQISHLRNLVTIRIEKASPGPTGALIAALITGQRSELPRATTDAMRSSGLAHLLAISGLHMSLVAGSLFALIRAVLAMSTTLALNCRIKKWAAVIALFGATFYLVLSGAGIATQRAFIMAAIAFAAIIVDRPAVTMRNIAVAALLILSFRPESLLTPGFQMSFATVVALVAVYDRSSSPFAAGKRRRSAPTLPRRVLRYFVVIGTTTIIAGLVTAPVAAYHFNRMTPFGLISNLAAVPIVALVVMPAAMLAVVAMPLGLDGTLLRVAALGAGTVVAIAEKVAGLPGSSIVVASPGMPKVLFIVFGGLWFCLWRTRWRWIGPVLVALGLTVPAGTTGPDILIARDLRNIAVRNTDGDLAVMTARRDRFAVERWLLADSDATSPGDAANRPGLTCDPLGCSAVLRNDTRLAYVGNAAILEEECARVAILITPLSVARSRCPHPKLLISRRQGKAAPYAIRIRDNGITVVSAATARGNRPWTRRKRLRTVKPAAPVSQQTGTTAQ